MKEEHLCKHYATNTGEREIGGFVFAWLKSAKERAALITAVAAIIVGVSGFYANKTFQAAQKGQTAASTRPFTLRVMDDAGSPIPHATVIAFQDQGVGQTLTTDSNGQIEVQVAPDTHSLRFTVTADGFANSTIQASIGRTGPEEVYLHPYVPSPARPAKKLKSPKQVSLISAAPGPTTGQLVQPPTPSTNNGIVNNAPNQGLQNNCAPGVVNCDQSVYLNTFPLPDVSFYSEKSTLEGFPGEDSSPSTTVKISVNKMGGQAFEIVCGSGCGLSEPWLWRSSRGIDSGTMVHLAEHRVSADAARHLIVLEQPLPPSQYLSLRVRPMGVEVISVKAVRMQ